MLISGLVSCNPDAKRLYDDLLSNYNSLIRPVPNNTQKLTVKLGLKLSQLIDVNLKDQVMTTNVWVEQVNNALYRLSHLVVDIFVLKCMQNVARGLMEILAEVVLESTPTYFHVQMGHPVLYS